MRKYGKAALWFSAHWCAFHYRVTQFLTRLEEPVVQPARDYLDVLLRIAYGTHYTPDGRRDRMAHPRQMQMRIHQNRQRIGDCEDHAAYWIAVLLKSDLADECLLGVLFYERSGSKEGHAVTVFRKGDEWFWVDYNSPVPLPERNAWADSVLERYGHSRRGAFLLQTTLGKGDTIYFGEHTLFPG